MAAGIQKLTHDTAVHMRSTHTVKHRASVHLYSYCICVCVCVCVCMYVHIYIYVHSPSFHIPTSITPSCRTMSILLSQLLFEIYVLTAELTMHKPYASKNIPEITALIRVHTHTHTYAHGHTRTALLPLHVSFLFPPSYYTPVLAGNVHTYIHTYVRKQFVSRFHVADSIMSLPSAKQNHRGLTTRPPSRQLVLAITSSHRQGKGLMRT